MMVQMMLFLLLSSTTIALASFGPDVRIDHKLPNHSCINCAITVGPGAPSNQPIYVAFEDDSIVGILNVLSDVMFQKSTDAGRTWLPTDVLVRDGAPHAYKPDITTDSDGNVYIVFRDVSSDTAGGYDNLILCVRSSDGGTTWTAPGRVDDRPDPKRSIGSPRIAADSAGNLLCAWRDKRTGSFHIWSSVSADRGATWSRNVQVDDDTTDYDCSHADVFVQPGTNHYLVAAEVPRRVGGHYESSAELYRSTDMGLTFQPRVHIDTFKYAVWDPHVVADRDHIICDYFADPFRVGDTLFIEARTFYTQGDSWRSPAPVTNLDSLHALYFSGKLALSGDGRVHTALMICDTADDGHYDVFYTSSSDYGVSWSDIEIVNDDTTVHCHSPDIGADSTGHAYIVWYRPNATRGEIWFATNAPSGIAEETSNAELRVPNSSPIVVRNVLFLAERPSSSASTSSLLDISGREVLVLKPGANDLSRLAPGVYFVHSGLSVAGRQPSSVTKVVVTR